MKAYRLGPVAGDVFRGITMRYRCEPGGPLPEYVVASAVIAYGDGPETYVFPCDAEGNVSKWGELEGSFRGALDCDRALRNAGYEVVDAE